MGSGELSVLAEEAVARPGAGVPAEHAADAGVVPRQRAIATCDLPDRDLTQTELEALAAGIAQQPESWAHHVALRRRRARLRLAAPGRARRRLAALLDPRERHRLARPRRLLGRGRRRVRASWSRTTSPWPHGARETRVGAGRVFSFGPDHIHRLNGAVHGSVSVHAYSPPLWRMGQYAVNDAGVLRRVSLSYADELRPIE